MPKKIWLVIPARFASYRFPGKPLAPLHGRPMLFWVWEACRRVRGIDEVIIATDDRRIAEALAGFGARVEMTAAHHQSGTERLNEIAAKFTEVEYFINVQGDEPGIESGLIESLIARLRKNEARAQVITAAAPITEEKEYLSRDVVKVVLNHRGQALYFSRAPIPCNRDKNQIFDDGDFKPLRHLGVYVYDGAFLRELPRYPQGKLARIEKLEQLEWLENGIAIDVVVGESHWGGIDTPEELAAFARQWQPPKVD